MSTRRPFDAVVPHRVTRAPLSAAIVACLVCVVLATACEQEKRIIYSDGLLSNIPDAKTKYPSKRQAGEISGTGKVANTKTIVENPDGTKTLYARTPKHLMNHIMYTLREDNADLFVNQVLSKATRDEYAARGVDPKEAFEIIKARQDDVLKLFKLIPMGEMTPGVFLQRVDGGAKRMMAEQRIAQDLKWRGIDMMFERGNYKLRWFVGE